MAGTNSGDEQAAPNSASGLVSTLIPSLLIALVFLALFLIFRVKVKKVYQPRTYQGTLAEYQKTPVPSQTRFGWISDFMRVQDAYVLNHHSMDAYFLLRFWKSLIVVCGFGWLLTWIILMPVYGTSHGIGQQFDKISYANINANVDGNRLYAVNFVGWIFFGAVMVIVGRESIHAVQVKQAFLVLPGIASRISSRTVLFTNVPQELMNEASLRKALPSVKHVWLSTDTAELEKLIKERDKVVAKLEGAEVKLSKTANDKRLKDLKANAKNSEKPIEDPVKWVDENKRPQHKLKFLIGPKVDTINWSRDELPKMNSDVESQQQTHRTGKAPYKSAAFVEFDNVQAAEAAFHKTAVEIPKGMKPRTVGTRPQEIVWKGINMSNSQHLIRNAVAVAIICLMIIFWIPIVAFIGALTNINSLTNKVAFLSFIDKIPPVILGVVTGLLPVVILAVCLALVPIIMRLLFKLAGAVTLAEVELKTQTWYFVFQVVQVFLVATVASAAAATATTIIQNPSSATSLLAANLPKASNFYINYFVLYGLAVAAKALLNIVALLIYLLLGKFLDSTPRKMYNRYTSIASIGWGSMYPPFTLLGVIAIIYACIAPLVLAFATISFFCLYIANRYAVIYSVDTLSLNTQGKSFAKAMQQLTTGVYIAELCLAGLFGISAGSNKSAAGPAALMFAFLVITAVYHFLLNRTIASMEKEVSRGADTENPGNKPLPFLAKLLRPSPLPVFDSYLETPVPELDSEIRHEAYLNPAIGAPKPFLWIAHDEMGISAREKDKTGPIVGITDEGAWFDSKTGKLTTAWVGHEDTNEKDWAREAPIYQEPVVY